MATYKQNSDGSIDKTLANGKTFNVNTNDPKWKSIAQEAATTGGLGAIDKTPSNNTVTPTVPTVPTAPQMPGVPQIDPYKSDYLKDINKALSDLQNIDPFSYDPANDASYQAYIQQQQQLGQTAFNNQLGTMSSATGGRPNSWAQSVASQAQGAYNQQAASAMPQFQQQAFSQYQDSNQLVMDQLKYVMGLDELAFEQHQTGTDNQYREYEAQMGQWADALAVKQNELQQAYDRVKLIGYVDNEASVALGVPPGTSSYEARTAAEERLNWIAQQEYELEEKIYLMGIEQQQAKELIKYRESVSGGSGGSGGGSSGVGYDKNSGGNPYGIKDASDAREFIDDMFDPENDQYAIMSEGELTGHVVNLVDDIRNDSSLKEVRKEEILQYIYEKSRAKTLLTDKNIDKYYNSYR